MIIFFDKIGTTPKPISLEVDGISLVGTLQKSGYHQVTLNSKLSGNIELRCDRCGTDYNYDVTSKLVLKLSDIVSENKVDLDIIEFLDGNIDISYILNSEINSITTSYNYCTKCDNNDEEFEREF
ncbi:MAG: hypothetical protein QM493_11815 [Sulfurovum sp.]